MPLGAFALDLFEFLADFFFFYNETSKGTKKKKKKTRLKFWISRYKQIFPHCGLNQVSNHHSEAWAKEALSHRRTTIWFSLFISLTHSPCQRESQQNFHLDVKSSGIRNRSHRAQITPVRIPTRTLTPSAAAPFSIPADSHVPSLHSQLRRLHNRWFSAWKQPKKSQISEEASRPFKADTGEAHVWSEPLVISANNTLEPVLTPLYSAQQISTTCLLIFHFIRYKITF